MSESIRDQTEDTHVYFTLLSHGRLAVEVTHLFGNASASSMNFKQGDQGFSCTNKRKQAPCWDDVFELLCLWFGTCME